MTIKRFGKQARSGGLPDTARAGKKISVMKPLMLDCVAQSARDGLLPGDFVKSLRAPFACDYLMGHLEGK
jgi:hypothetical protein